MDSDRHQKITSPSPPPPSALAAPQYSTNLRVRRPKSIRNNGIVIARKANNSPSSQFKNECYSALLPVLLIGGIWCFGCYLYLWISLYQSFNADVDDNVGYHATIIFHKRKDILAIKLEHFLTGTGASENDDIDSNTRENDIELGGSAYRTINFNMTLLEQIADPIRANQIQSTLTSQTGYPNLILGAYLEPPLSMDDETMKLRTHTPENLKYASYPYEHNEHTKINGDDATDNQPKLGACSRKGAQWIFPTSHPKSLDKYFESNVFKKHPNFDKRWELALGAKSAEGNNHNNKGHCPVDADPYLPWIHDAFPSNDGHHVEFIISNKRRCNTDPKIFQSDLKNLEPQVALMQPIPVKRIKSEEEDTFSDALKKLWSPHRGRKNNQTESLLAEDYSYDPPKYILGASLNDADEDGKYTRFICRFYTIIVEEESGSGSITSDQQTRLPKLRKLILGETLSNYPYNPEHANYRKRGSKPMLTSMEQGHDEQIWNSVYTFRCPVPRFTEDSKNTTNHNNTLASIIASGKSVFRDVPSLYLDLIPIRTPVRRNREGFGVPGVTQSPPGEPPWFDPKLTWGESHVVPRVEASGRWTNIPVCRPPKVEEDSTVESTKPAKLEAPTEIASTSPAGAKNKTHFLVACVWASQSFSTRGQTTDTDSSTSARLREFLTYHTQLAGFDHVYVYDNSDPNSSSLADVTNSFSHSLVTRIPWPHRVCNNNRPMHANPGERSSQYAAENSCRARYGPDTTWMTSLDVDEYLIPTGTQWKNVRHWLEHVTDNEESTKILSFFQTRALPDIDTMTPYDGEPTSACKVDGGVGAKSGTIMNSMCLMKDSQKTFMETYNCEPTTHPKPQAWAWRAKKQIYRPDFVLNHFVHYSVVTRQILDKPHEPSPRFVERAPFERRVNELTEGFLLHTKTTGPEMTSKWREKCIPKGNDITKNSSCKVGIASPTTVLGDEANATMPRGDNAEHSDTFESNCYRHSRIISEWIPKLEVALQSQSKP